MHEHAFFYLNKNVNSLGCSSKRTSYFHIKNSWGFTQDIYSLRQVTELPCGAGIRCLSWTPSSRLLASAGEDGVEVAEVASMMWLKLQQSMEYIIYGIYGCRCVCVCDMMSFTMLLMFDDVLLIRAYSNEHNMFLQWPANLVSKLQKSSLAPGYACLRMGRPGSPSEGGRGMNHYSPLGKRGCQKNSLWIQDKRRKLEENLKIVFKSTV